MNYFSQKESAMSSRYNDTDSAKEGYFGPYGGQFVPESLIGPLDAIYEAFKACRDDTAFNEEMRS